MFAPIYAGNGNYLALPDDRDATWLELDGKAALSPLARISAVQFTLDIDLDSAIRVLNRFLGSRELLLATYPQDDIWREYVRSSAAGYREDRYGGPSQFGSLEHYCSELASHSVVHGPALVPFDQALIWSNEDISLFIRSIWWYFRLRRYGWNLCVEVRPLARRRDDELPIQLEQVCEIAGV